MNRRIKKKLMKRSNFHNYSTMWSCEKLINQALAHVCEKLKAKGIEVSLRNILEYEDEINQELRLAGSPLLVFGYPMSNPDQIVLLPAPAVDKLQNARLYFHWGDHNEQTNQEEDVLWCENDS